VKYKVKTSIKLDSLNFLNNTYDCREHPKKKEEADSVSPSIYSVHNSSRPD
jgi:hypothetical protein